MKKNDGFLLIRGKYLIPISEKKGKNKIIEDGFVLSKNSKIIRTGKFTEKIGKDILTKYGKFLKIVGSSKKSGFKIKDIKCHNGVLLPGFVKAHGHDHESPIIGIAKDVPLSPWLDRAVNLFTGFMNEKRNFLEKKFKKSPNYVTYIKARLDDIHYGITASMVHHCNHNKYRVEEIVKANVQAGTKMIVAVGSQDQNYDKRILDIPGNLATDRLDEYIKLYGDVERTQIIPGPDQIFSNSKELLKRLKDWANAHNTLIHIHSSEEPNTTAWFKKTYKKTPIAMANSIKFLDENTVVAHQVNNTKNDLKLLQKTGTKVVHNPLANTILGSGMPPIIEMLKLGIPVAISTDGSGSADNQSIISAARLASQYQKALHQDATLLPAQKVLEMITIEPAKILNMNCGSLDNGKDADIILLDLDRPNMTPTRKDNLIENIIWAADGSEISTVIANGKVLKENYKFKTLNAKKIKEEVQELSEELIKYRKTAKAIKGTGSNK